MKHFLPLLLLCLPAAAWAQPPHARDHFSDDPFLTGGTKSILIRPLQPQSVVRARTADPRAVEIDIDKSKYSAGITSFKIISGTETHVIKKRDFEIVFWPNLLIITQDLPAGKVIIRSRQGFARVRMDEVLDYINARPEKVFLKVGKGIFSSRKTIDCPDDCSFVLGARPNTAAKP